MADVLNGIVVWYKFEDTVTTDSSGNGYTGTLIGSPLPTLGPGKIGQGMVFGGPTGGVALPPAAVAVPTATSSFSVMAWLKTTAVDTPIFGGRNSGNGNPIIDLTIGFNGATNAGTGKATVIIRDNNGTGISYPAGTTAINDGTFHHVAAVFDGSGGINSQTITLYVDGAQQATASGPLQTGITLDTLGCNVGRENTQNWGCQGTIDDFRFYNRALSATEISNVYNAGNLVLLQHFDIDFRDATGRHTAITPDANAALTTTHSQFGAGSLDATYGTTSNLTITDNLSDFTFTGDFTVDCWFDPLNFGYSGQGLFDIGNTSLALHTGYYWTGTQNIVTLAATVGALSLYDTTQQQPTGTWYHCAVTRHAGTVYLFTNGVLVASGTDSSTLTPASTGVKVGTFQPSYYPTQGYIDELRVINGAAAWTAAFTPPTAPYLPPDAVSGITGTLAITQAAQTLSAASRVTVGGTLSVTQAAQTLSAAGGVRVSGTLALTEVPDTISAAGGPRVGGTLGITQAAQTLSAAGGPRVGGTLTITQAAETLSATGNVALPGITGTLAITQANQTLSAAGGPRVGGTLTVTQANQTLSATGAVILVGNLTTTQAAQTLVAAGGPVDGAHLTITQAAQTLSAAGTVAIGGTLNVTQANNTLIAAGGVTVRGTLAVNQAAQTLSATGSVLSGIVGTLSITQANQTLSAAGNVPNVIGGSLHVTQAAQTLSATGTVFTGVTGTLAITQANQTLSATGTVPIGAITGTLTLTQTAQTLSATGTAPGPGIEAMHTLSRGSLYVAGSVKTAAGPVSGLPHPGRVGTRNFVTDATVPLASGAGNIVTGGGSNRVPVYDDGSNWRIG